MRTRPALTVLIVTAAAWPLPGALATAADSQRDGASEVHSRMYEIVSRVENLSGTQRTSTSNASTTYGLQASVLFAKDSAKVSPSAESKLEALAVKIAKAKPNEPVEVCGYTDNLGSAAHGLELSRERADAIKKLIAARDELAGISFRAKGYGEADPIADNRTEAGRQKNRRVELVVPT